MNGKELLSEQIQTLPITASSALVEAGHIYAGLQPEATEVMGLEIGSHVKSVLSELGMSVSTMLFVDDYNRTGDIDSTIKSTISYGDELGFSPGEIVLEKDLVQKAEELIVKLSGTGATVIRKSRIRFLVGRSKDGRYDYYIDLKVGPKYTCEVLDAALYLEKAEKTNNGLLVTVLPDGYKQQQKKTKDLVRAAGCNAPILNVYYNNAGKIEVDFDY